MLTDPPQTTPARNMGLEEKRKSLQHMIWYVLRDRLTDQKEYTNYNITCFILIPYVEQLKEFRSAVMILICISLPKKLFSKELHTQQNSPYGTTQTN